MKSKDLKPNATLSKAQWEELKKEIRNTYVINDSFDTFTKGDKKRVSISRKYRYEVSGRKYEAWGKETMSFWVEN